jgi:hypothetical protein
MDSNGTVDLHHIGDVELWFAEGADSSWRLPLHVEWKENPSTKERFGLVLTPLCFYETQLTALRVLFQERAQEVEADQINGWLLHEGDVVALLRKAPGIHAEFYYDWLGTEPPVTSTYRKRTLRKGLEPRRLESYRDFAEFISRERHLPEDVVLTVFNAICQLGARWLLDRKTLDLGFVRLVALPFRVNWKQVLAWKCRPWRLLTVLRYPQDLRKQTLAHHKFKDALESIHNVGLRGKRLDFTIEAIQTRNFEKTVDEMEELLAKKKDVSEVQRYQETVKELYEQIVEAMVHYSQKIIAPWAKLHTSSLTGVETLLHFGRHSHRVRGAFLHELPDDTLPTHPAVPLPRKSEPATVPAPAAQVPQVSVVPPPASNLRRRRLPGDVGEPRPGGTNGLPVLDAGEGPAPG